VNGTAEVVFHHRIEAACLLQFVVAVDGGFLDHLIQLSSAEVRGHDSLWVSTRRSCCAGMIDANLRADAWPSCCQFICDGFPRPRVQFIDPVVRVIGGPRDDVAQVSFWIEPIELGGLDERITSWRLGIPPLSEPAKR
jgi:hypothetical protein